MSCFISVYLCLSITYFAIIGCSLAQRESLSIADHLIRGRKVLLIVEITLQLLSTLRAECIGKLSILLHKLGHLQQFVIGLIHLQIHILVSLHLHKRGWAVLNLLYQVCLFQFVNFCSLSWRRSICSRFWPLLLIWIWSWFCNWHRSCLIFGLGCLLFWVFGSFCRSATHSARKWGRHSLSLRILHVHLLHQLHLFEEFFRRHLPAKHISHLCIFATLIWAFFHIGFFLHLLWLVRLINFRYFVLFSLKDLLSRLHQSLHLLLFHLICFLQSLFLVNSRLFLHSFPRSALASLRSFTLSMQWRFSPILLFSFSSLHTLVLLFDNFSHNLLSFGFFDLFSLFHFQNIIKELSAAKS